MAAFAERNHFFTNPWLPLKLDCQERPAVGANTRPPTKAKAEPLPARSDIPRTLMVASASVEGKSPVGPTGLPGCGSPRVHGSGKTRARRHGVIESRRRRRGPTWAERGRTALPGRSVTGTLLVVPRGLVVYDAGEHLLRMSGLSWAGGPGGCALRARVPPT